MTETLEVEEIWIKAVGKFINGKYSVSNKGRIRRDIGGKGAKIGKILKGSSVKGYPTINLLVKGRPCRRHIHSIVAESFMGKLPVGLEVNHKDGSRNNNHLSNLEYVTHKENMAHAARTGRYKTKLSKDIIIDIRKEHDVGNTTCAKLAKKHGMDASSISDIIRRATWSHV